MDLDKQQRLAELISFAKGVVLNRDKGLSDYSFGGMNLSADEQDNALREGFKELFGTDKPTHQIIRENEPMIFNITEDVITVKMDSGWGNSPFFNTFVEYRNLALGDTNEFYVGDKTRLISSIVSDGNWDLQAQRVDVGQKFSIAVKSHGVKVRTEWELFVTGRTDFVELINKISDAIKFDIDTEIYHKFIGTMNLLPANFVHEGNISEDKVLDIIDNVKASTGANEIIIVGTRKSLRKLTNTYRTGSNSYLMSDKMKNEQNMSGELERWEGHVLMELNKPFAPNTFDFMIEDDFLLFLPANTKPIKFVNEGRPMMKSNMSNTDNMDMSIDHTLLVRYGMSVIFDMYYGMYKITA